VPEYTQYAAANMTGSNRLLMGIGWPVVVLISVLVARKATGRKVGELDLDASNRVEIGFLMIAGVVAFVVPATGRIHIAFGLVLLAWFGFYLFKLSRGEVEEPELVGTAAALGALPDRVRRIAVCMQNHSPRTLSMLARSWASTASCWCSGWRRCRRRRRNSSSL
jgi:cation:H+ antiporter